MPTRSHLHTATHHNTHRPDPRLAALDLSHDTAGRLLLSLPDLPAPLPVEPVRAFPFTDPTRWISLCSSDGREVLSIPDLASLPPHPRRILEEALAATEFIPTVLRIHSVSKYSAPTRWDIETDRGPTTLVIDHDDDVRQIGPHTIVIVDEHGVRYQIPDHTQLDPHSLKLLRRFL